MQSPLVSSGLCGPLVVSASLLFPSLPASLLLGRQVKKGIVESNNRGL